MDRERTLALGEYPQDEATLRKDAFPTIGSIPVDTITPPDILKALRPIEKRGSLDSALPEHCTINHYHETT